jgi:hypothetical protein
MIYQGMPGFVVATRNPIAAVAPKVQVGTPIAGVPVVEGGVAGAPVGVAGVGL